MDPVALVIYIVVFALHAFSGVLPVKIPAAVLVILAGVAGVIISDRRNRAARKEGDAK